MLAALTTKDPIDLRCGQAELPARQWERPEQRLDQSPFREGIDRRSQACPSWRSVGHDALLDHPTKSDGPS